MVKYQGHIHIILDMFFLRQYIEMLSNVGL